MPIGGIGPQFGGAPNAGGTDAETTEVAIVEVEGAAPQVQGVAVLLAGRAGCPVIEKGVPDAMREAKVGCVPDEDAEGPALENSRGYTGKGVLPLTVVGTTVLGTEVVITAAAPGGLTLLELTIVMTSPLR